MKKILWLSDVPKWAYHNRFLAISKELPEYQHNIFYLNPKTFSVLNQVIVDYDIIICSFHKWISLCPDKKKIIAMLTGTRQWYVSEDMEMVQDKISEEEPVNY